MHCNTIMKIHSFLNLELFNDKIKHDYRVDKQYTDP